MNVLDAAALIMGDLARDLKRIFSPRQSSLERYLEHLRIEGEAAAREAKAAAAEWAAREQELQEWLEEQRRRLEEELEAIRSHGRTAGLTAFHLAAIGLAQRAQPTPKKSRRTDGETGEHFPRAAFPLAYRVRSGFGAVQTIMRWTRPGRQAAPRHVPPVAVDEFATEAFGPPNPCNPFDPAWQQPFTEDQPAFAENFEDAAPPADCPSANL